jgi:hypothetical protein
MMSDYKRLTSFVNGNRAMLVIPQRKERITEYVVRLAELENKLESGQLIEFKYKVGDELYGVRSIIQSMKINKKIMRTQSFDVVNVKVSDVAYYTNSKKYYDEIVPFWFNEDELYITKEEAEAKAKELRNRIGVL